MMSYPVLMYHGFRKNSVDDKSLTVDINEFRHQLFYLKDTDYHSVLNPKQCADTSKPVIITFDDALFSVFDLAFPLMEEFGFKGIVFLPTAIISESIPYDCEIEYGENDRFMTTNELNILLQHGWQIQSHAHTHQKLTELTFDQINDEFTLSKKIIEEKFNTECNMIAYPYGSYNRFVIGFSENNGFKYGFSVHQGLVNHKSDKMRLPRLEISSNINLQTFINMLKTGYQNTKEAKIGKLKHFLFKSVYVKDVIQSLFPEKIN